MRIVLLLLITALVSGCTLNSPPQRTPGPIASPRAGDVFLVRGLLGVFSTGMDELHDQLAVRGVSCVTLQHTEGASAAQWIIDNYRKDSGPIVLVGHSLGANEVVAMAAKLQAAKVPVALMVTLDPVTAGPVPDNVRRTLDYYRSQGVLDALPVFRGIPLHARPGSPAVVHNIDVNDHPELLEPATNHFTIDKNHRIQKEILNQILSVCPTEVRPSGAIRASATVPPSGP